jgi:hypothetical protein
MLFLEISSLGRWVGRKEGRCATGLVITIHTCYYKGSNFNPILQLILKMRVLKMSAYRQRMHYLYGK